MMVVGSTIEERANCFRGGERVMVGEVDQSKKDTGIVWVKFFVPDRSSDGRSYTHFKSYSQPRR